jgi:hypothetical protein
MLETCEERYNGSEEWSKRCAEKWVRRRWWLGCREISHKASMECDLAISKATTTLQHGSVIRDHGKGDIMLVEVVVHRKTEGKTIILC